MMTRTIATLGGIGYLPAAPGTWGSLAALPLAWGIYALVGWFGFVVALGVMTGLALWAIRHETVRIGVKDPSEVVVDELVGQWIALLPVAYGAYYTGAAFEALYPGWIVAFFGFRLFDITKPWLVGRADRKGTPWGVIEDDIWAGVFAALVVVILAVLAHVVFL